MSSELISALSDLAAERGIDQLAVLERLEQDLARSYKGILDLDWDAQVTIDRESGRIFVYEMVGIGEEDPETGEYEDYEPRDVTPENVSRIAAQNAKRVINEIVRDAARASIYKEFADRKGELITGTVLQTTPDFTIIKIRDGVEPSCRTSTGVATRTSATSARPTSITSIISVSRRSSSTYATQASRRRAPRARAMAATARASS